MDLTVYLWFGRSPNKLSQDSTCEQDEDDNEEEEEPEDGAISDPFVFSKEDFDSGKRNLQLVG